MDNVNDGGIMIILHNHRLQNQCFRPSLHQRTHSNVTAIESFAIPKQPQVEKVIEMRKSCSSGGEYFGRKQNKSHLKDKQKFQMNNYMANHFLSDVKQKFKEIFKHKNQTDQLARQMTAKPSDKGMNSGKKMLNLSLNCQSASIVDKRMLLRSQFEKTVRNKRLIDVKRSRLYKGTHRDHNELMRKQMNNEYELGISRFSQREIQSKQMQEDMEQSYLRSQYGIFKQKKEEKGEDRAKTQKKTIQHTRNPLSLNKYESEMLNSPAKRQSPFLQQEYSQNQVKFNLLSQMKCKLINDQHFSVRNQNARSRQHQKKREKGRQFKSKASLQLNYQS